MFSVAFVINCCVFVYKYFIFIHSCRFLSSSLVHKGMFVWRDFRKDGKLRKENGESIFSGCFVGREEKKVMGPRCFLHELTKIFSQNCPQSNVHYFPTVFFFFGNFVQLFSYLLFFFPLISLYVVPCSFFFLGAYLFLCSLVKLHFHSLIFLLNQIKEFSIPPLFHHYN